MSLKLNPEPTFKAFVAIPIPGGAPERVEFTFKHRRVSEVEEFRKTIAGRTNAEIVGDLIVGWALNDEFNAENIARLVDAYPGATIAIIDAYYAELFKARQGN